MTYPDPYAPTTDEALWGLGRPGAAGEPSGGRPADPPEPPEPPEGTFDDPGPEAAEAARQARQAVRDADDLAREVRYLKLRRQATKVVEADEHAAAWKRPIEYGTLADELELPELPVTYRVDRVLPTGANVVLTAQYKTGKTTLMNHLVRCLADGEEFLGKYPIGPLDGRVGVFNYEVSEAQYRRWMRDVGVRNPGRVALLHLRGKRLPLAVREIEEYVTDWLKRHEIQAWVLDPYARALIGSGEENDNSAVGAFLDTLDVIKANAGVEELAMAAHTGRYEQTAGEERARGATRIDDWPDVRWILTREKEGDRRYLKCTGRDVEEAEQALAYDPQTRALRVVGGSRTITRRLGLEEELLAFIGGNPGLGTNELIAAFPKNRNDIVNAIRSLEATKRIHIEIGPHRKRAHFPVGTYGETVDTPWNRPDPQVGLF
jgi:hypothetical protein